MQTKKSVIDLVNIAYAKGIRKVVFSSGSRNAPLIIAFNEHGGFETYSIHDERSAAFVALGISQQTREIVAIACTSGSAALNYAPAVAEAYYQRIPLLVITADRPLEWIDQGEGQTMRQHNIYANYIKRSFEIFQETDHPDEVWYNTRMFNEAINLCKISPCGPVHINLPLREPLYNVDYDFNSNITKVIENISPLPYLPDDKMDELAEIWNSSKRKMILTGILPFDDELKDVLLELSEDDSVIVLTETTSNISDDKFINNIDRFIMSISPDEEEKFKPEILVTIGSNIVSKKIKALLRKWSPREHWDIDESDTFMDTYKALNKHIKSELKSFLKGLGNRKKNIDSCFRDVYLEREKHVQELHKKYLNDNLPWPDLQAYEILFEALPANVNIQMANSTAVRYAQLMPSRYDIIYNSNRGVAGIDGCTSTSVGAAMVNQRLTVLFTGDVAFLYDSNALWNNYLPENLRIIVFNNHGGNIFRFIKGPGETKQLKEFFEAQHDVNVEKIAEAFNVNYYTAENIEELKEVLKVFFNENSNNRPSILELFTPREKNMDILKNYFANLLN
ncbi:MAG: 2-succinyl-5-enolpyruvyl-6-hydroxy-3-cyclohexene-1-carboxylic-acid synthase [Saprospiraceae bacterium]